MDKHDFPRDCCYCLEIQHLFILRKERVSFITFPFFTSTFLNSLFLQYLLVTCFFSKGERGDCLENALVICFAIWARKEEHKHRSDKWIVFGLVHEIGCQWLLLKLESESLMRCFPPQWREIGPANKQMLMVLLEHLDTHANVDVVKLLAPKIWRSC